jgi:D-alanine-D-alanine ligase
VAARDDELVPAVEAALAQGGDALVEAFVPGVEVSVGVLGNSGGELRALPPIEIRPAEGRFFDYQQKYDPAGARELCPAESLDPGDDRRLREAALLTHRVAGCDGYSRVDFIVPARRAARAGDPRPVLLEVNTLPGLTPRSLLPQEAQVSGLDFRGLCLELLSLALSR